MKQGCITLAFFQPLIIKCLILIHALIYISLRVYKRRKHFDTKIPAVPIRLAGHLNDTTQLHISTGKLEGYQHNGKPSLQLQGVRLWHLCEIQKRTLVHLLTPSGTTRRQSP